MLRSLTVGLAALAAACAVAQFDGPAPLAWRWYQPTSVSPISPPTVDGDTLYYSLGSRVFCLDRASGNLKWRFPTVDPIEGAFRAAPIKVGDLVVAVGDNQIMYGINPANGELVWTYNTPGRIIGQPVLVGKFLIASQADNKLIAVDPTNGQPVWSQPFNIFDGIGGQLGSNGDDVLVFTTRQQLLSINVLTQKTSWRQRFTQLEPNAIATVANGAIYVASGPFVIALNPTTGMAKWQADSRLTTLAFAPAASASRILVVSREGKAMGFDLNGKPINRTPVDLGSLPITSPTAVGDLFIVPTSNGAVNLVDPAVAGRDTKLAPTGRPDVILPGKVEAPSADLLWSFLVKPLFPQATGTTNPMGGRGPGGGMGIGGGMNIGGGGFGQGGGGGLVGGGGQIGGGGQFGNQNNQPLPAVSVQAAAPAVLAGQMLLLAAKDGSLLAFDKDLGVDFTPPSVKMVWPNAGDQVSGQPPLELIFKIDDEATGVDVRSLKITVGGEPMDFTYTRDGFATVRISTLGKNKPLQNGRKDIEVNVGDWLGNATKSTFSLTVDNQLRPLIRPGTQPNAPGNNNRPGQGGGGKTGGMGAGI